MASIDGGPSSRSLAVTTSDANAQAVGRGIFVGTGGNITGRLADDTVDTVWKGLNAGNTYPLRFSFIRATGTTAADILILF